MTDFVWPPENKEPTATMPFYCSGEYSADPLNVSPEGNVYGQERCVVMDPKAWWWTGESWGEIPTYKAVIQAKGQVHSAAELPAVPESIDDIWQVRFYNPTKNEYDWVEHYWDSAHEGWKPLQWLWHVDMASQLPTPGKFIGEAHWVINWHQKFRWVGTGWMKRRHSELADDEPQKHLPVGFLQNFQGALGNIDGLFGSLNALTGRVDDLSEDADILQGTVNGISGEVSALTGTVNGVTGEVTDLTATVNLLTGEVTNVQGTVAGHTGSITNLQGTVDGHSGQLTSLSQSIDTVTGDITNLQGTVAGHAGSISGLTGTVDGHTGQITNLTGTVDLVTGEVTGLRGTVDGHTGTITNLQGTVDGHTGQLTDLTGSVDLLDMAVTTLQSDVSAIAADLEERYGQMSRYYNPDARLVFLSPTKIGLERVAGGAGVVNVAGEWVTAGPTRSVLNTVKAVGWNEETHSLYQVAIQADTHYWIYLANTNSAEFVFGDYDYRGKLFLSPTADTDDYLSDNGAGAQARLVGQVTTDLSNPPQFHRDLNLSLINRLTNFAETYREFSDYQLVFVDQDHLEMALGYGLYGQIDIAGYLYYLGNSTPTLNRTGNDSNRVEWDDQAPGNVFVDTSPIQAGQIYYVYIAADVDALNFNAVNPATGRPWQVSDVGAESNYVVALDLRLKPFLSKKQPASGVMSAQWPGYVVRFVGQVRTDNNGYFVNAPDISAIRQMTLNPAHFDGLAECSLVPVSETEFRTCKKGGTSGIVMVGGSSVQTYEKFDADVHVVANTNLVQAYTESNISAPLSNLNAISTYTNQDLYVYLANYRSLWGAKAGKVFVSTIAPTQGYLSRNWPGNQARWLATIRPDANGKFTGSYVREALTQATLKIDDATATLNDTWSSAKILAEFNNVWVALQASNVYNSQKVSGIGLKLEYRDSTHLAVVPVSQSVTVVFPDLTNRTIDEEILVTPAGSPGTTYYVWLKQAAIEIDTTAPTQTFAKMAIHGTDAILLGYFCVTSANTLSGVQNVYSYVHEPEREWSAAIDVGTPFSIGQCPANGLYETLKQTVIALPGLLVPPGVNGLAVRETGSTRWRCYIAGGATYHTADLTGVTDDSYYWEYPTGYYGTGTLTLAMNPGDAVAPGIYAQISFDILLSVDWHFGAGTNRWFTVDFHTGSLVFTRPGS